MWSTRWPIERISPPLPPPPLTARWSEIAHGVCARLHAGIGKATGDGAAFAGGRSRNWWIASPIQPFVRESLMFGRVARIVSACCWYHDAFACRLCGRVLLLFHRPESGESGYGGPPVSTLSPGD